MIPQEIFNKVYKHLLTQNETSRDAEGCAYRGSKGRMCAVGCLIPDEIYKTSMENLTISHLMTIDLDVAELLNVDNEDLLMDLQYVHDSSLSTDWKDRLVDIAKVYELTIPEETR